MLYTVEIDHVRIHTMNIGRLDTVSSDLPRFDSPVITLPASGVKRRVAIAKATWLSMAIAFR